jgi:hypothetical protein
MEAQGVIWLCPHRCRPRHYGYSGAVESRPGGGTCDSVSFDLMRVVWYELDRAGRLRMTASGPTIHEAETANAVTTRLTGCGNQGGSLARHTGWLTVGRLGGTVRLETEEATPASEDDLR